MEYDLAYALIAFLLGTLAGFQAIYDTYEKSYGRATLQVWGILYLLSRGILPAGLYALLYSQGVFKTNLPWWAAGCGVCSEGLLRSKFYFYSKKKNKEEGIVEEVLWGGVNLFHWYQNFFMKQIAGRSAISKRKFVEKHLETDKFYDLFECARTNLGAIHASEDKDHLENKMATMRNEFELEIKESVINAQTLNRIYCMNLGYLALDTLGNKGFEALLKGCVPCQAGLDSGTEAPIPSPQTKGNSVSLFFKSTDDLKKFVFGGKGWSIQGDELVAEKCGGENNGPTNYATYATAYKSITSVVFIVRIVPPSKNNIRIFVGQIHLLFNWECEDENHFRNGTAELVKRRPRALTPGAEHKITIKQDAQEIVTDVDGKEWYRTQGSLKGTISFQGSLFDTVAVRTIIINGEPDTQLNVVPENRHIP